MMGRSFRALGFLALWSCGLGCLETETPPTPVFGSLQVGVRASQGISLLDGILTLDEARFNLRRIDVEPDTGLDPGVEYEGPFLINLVEGGEVVNEEVPPVGETSVLADAYSRIRFRIDPVESLEGMSVVVEGSFEEAGDNDLDGSGDLSRVPFRFATDMGADLLLSIPEPFTVSGGETRFIFLAMRLTSWLEPALIPLQDLSPADLTDGVAVLRPDSDRETVRQLANVIEDAIRIGTRFAQSEDAEFDEDDVEEGSSSGIDFGGRTQADRGEGAEEGSGGSLRLTEVRVCAKEIKLSGEQDSAFPGPFVFSVVREGLPEESVSPPFESLEIPAEEYEKLEVPFDKLKAEEIPEESLVDEVVTRVLVDNTFVAVGTFRESPLNDIDGDGRESEVPFTLVSDDNYSMLKEEGSPDLSLIFPYLTHPDSWFEGTLSFFQGLDPSVLTNGSIFLSDSSPSEGIREIVKQVEENFKETPP